MSKDKKIEPRIQAELDKIHDITENRYTTRPELMEMITFPENSQNLIVISSNDKGVGFLKTCYDGRYCAGIVTKDEFDTIVEKASNLIGKVYSNKRKMDSQGVPVIYKLSLLVAALISFIFLVMAYYLPEKSIAYQVFTFILLGISLTIVALVSLINFCQKTSRILTFDEMVMDKVGTYFDQLNQNEYYDRKMEWFLVPGHYWLELRIMQQRNNFVAETGNNVYTTNIETAENRLMTHNGKGRKGEELKTEGPLRSKEVSKEGRLSDLLQNDSEED
jgi:multidrug transporter EmrE-like cation transporter